MEEKIFHMMEAVICEVTGAAKLTMDTEFINDLALNSMDLANLVCEFETRFHTEIDLRDVKNMVQIKDAVDYIIEKKLLTEEELS